MGFLGSLKSLDAYPKLPEDFKVKTLSGALVSVTSLCFILYLFVSELYFYLQVETVDHLSVDTSRGERIKINFEVTFPHIPCPLISVDAMDVTGAHQLDVNHHIKKAPLDPDGNPKGQPSQESLGRTLKQEELKTDVEGEEPKQDPSLDPSYCGSCYGAEETEGQCCNTCQEVQDAYRAKGWSVSTLDIVEQCLADSKVQEEYNKMLKRGDGCTLSGYLQVKKVAGNFHFAPGKSFQHAHMHVHDLAALDSGEFNVSHTIQHLSFGEAFPGIIDPLDGVSKSLPADVKSAMYMYYAKVVPTMYQSANGMIRDTNQFSVTEHFRELTSVEAQGLPGVFVFYELSPMKVEYTEARKPLSHFLTQLCAILGGAFTVAGMIDRMVYVSLRSLSKKTGMGKQT